MQTKIKTFTSPEFGAVRTAGTPENPLFMAKDLAKSLGLAKPFKAGERFRKEDTVRLSIGEKGGKPLFLTIRGMRDALLNSKSSKGDLIYNWISREVVPILTSKPDTVKQKGGPTPTRPLPKKQGAETDSTPTGKKASEPEIKFSAFFLTIRTLDEMCDYVARTLGGINGADVPKHIDPLAEAVFQSKAAILDIVRDLILVKGARVSSIAHSA